jgi:hypothetical protein
MNENDLRSYRAINVYVEREHLEDVLERILKGINSLSKPEQIEFIKKFKQYVKVNGFRNPTMAPLPLRVNAYAIAFEDKDETVPFTLSTWTKINPDLANEVKSWLEDKGWEDLALVREYDEDGGFKSDWPEDFGSEDLIADFQKDHPESSFEPDDITLMALWVSGKLPRE